MILLPRHPPGDNSVPPNLPALEAFLRRRAIRAERAAAWRHARGQLTAHQLDRIARNPGLEASFLPPGSNIHRSNNINFPDAGSTDPLAALVTLLVHFDSSFTALGTPGGAATLIGAPTLAGPPMFGAGAMHMVNQSQYARYNGNVIKGNGALTVEGWIRPSNIASGQQSFCSSLDLVGGSFFWVMQMANTGIGRFIYNVRGGSVDTGANFANGVYSAFALSLAAGTPVNGARAFINGTAVNTGTANAGNGGSPTGFLVGNDFNGTDGMPGEIDEFRITWAQRYTANYTPAGPFPDP